MSKLYLVAVDESELRNSVFEAADDEQAKQFIKENVDLVDVGNSLTLYRLTPIANYAVK